MLNTIKSFIFNLFSGIAARVTHFARNHYFLTGGGVLVALIALSIATRLFGNGALATPETNLPRAVKLSDVASLSRGAETLTTIGEIIAQEQATVRAEKGGKVTHVYRKLGDRVSAGTIIAEIDSASERASLLSAQGSVDAAQANLARISGGSRAEQQAILNTNLDTAKNALAGAQEAAANSLKSIYAQASNAVLVTADSMIANPTTPTPNFTVRTANSELERSVESQRIALGTLLKRQAQANTIVNAQSNLLAELAATEAELKQVLAFFDVLIAALNVAVPTPEAPATAIATYQSNASSARAGVVSSLSTIVTTRESLTSKQNAITVAEQNLAQGVSGGDPNEIAAAEAALKQARGGLAQAQATYEKAIIRAPITGTIDSFSITRGDYIQALTPAVSISNRGNLEVRTYLTEYDTARISINQAVAIEGGAQGVVARKGSSVDPVTKKVEVRVAVTKAIDTLTAGSNTILTFTENTAVTETPERLTIPITALRITAAGESVFRVENGALVEVPVTTGSLLGERVEILDGITGDSIIVTDARSLRAGQEVSTE